MDIAVHHNDFHHFDPDNHHLDLNNQNSISNILHDFHHLPQTHDDGIHRPLAHRNCDWVQLGRARTQKQT